MESTSESNAPLSQQYNAGIVDSLMASIGDDDGAPDRREPQRYANDQDSVMTEPPDEFNSSSAQPDTRVVQQNDDSASCTVNAPLLDDNDDIGEATGVGHTSDTDTKMSESGSDGESDSDGYKGVASKPQAKSKAPPPKRKSVKPFERSPSKRLAKHPHTSVEDEGDSSSNPIDVDLYASIWEPSTVNELVSVPMFQDGISFVWQVELSESDFVNHFTAPRFKCETEIRGFNANGGEHSFTLECHVSYLLLGCLLQIITTFSLMIALHK